MSGGLRSLPGRPSLRFLKLEAKRRCSAVYGGVAVDSSALLHIRVSDGRTHLVLTNRPIGIESIDGRLLRSWTNQEKLTGGNHAALSG